MDKDLDRVVLSYHDSRKPSVITLAVRPGKWDGGASLALSPADAVKLADRLLTAVRAEGWTLTAKHPNAR
jgi:hypothetical protein